MAVATGLLIAGGAAALAGGVGSYLANMSAADRAAALQDKQLQEWIKINIPDPKEQELALEKFVSQGKLVPQLEQAIKQQPTEFSKITQGVQERAAQNRALQELQNIGNSGGLRLQDKAALQEAQMASTNRARGDRMAIEADMARRGMGSSGFALQSQLGAQQADADRNARSSLTAAASAQDRALQALIQGGQLGTQMRSQGFQEQSAKAQAQDAINRFNSGNLQDVQSRNIASQNAAQAANLAAAQQLSNMNTNLSNDQQKFNNSLIQQRFENEMAIARGKQGVLGGQAQAELARGQQTGNFFQNLGQTAAGTTASIAGLPSGQARSANTDTPVNNGAYFDQDPNSLMSWQNYIDQQNKNKNKTRV